jgi:hypothetical protein
MPSAAYYRLLAKECFQSADQEQDNAKAEILRARGREYSELAQALDPHGGRAPEARRSPPDR